MKKKNKSRTFSSEKRLFFEENFSNGEKSTIVVGVNNTVKGVYLDEETYEKIGSNYFEFKFPNTVFSIRDSADDLSIVVTDLGIRGLIDKKKFHFPWKNIEYISVVRSGQDPVNKKWE